VAITTTEILFERAHPQSVVAAMRRMQSSGEGEGWINLHPLLSDDQATRLPEQTTIGSWFSGRGPAVSNATWTPAQRTKRETPAQVGISHGTGPGALDRLEELGLALPAGWTKRQDHAKHGIVADVPETADQADVLRWMLDACTALPTVVRAGDDWVAAVHGFDLGPAPSNR